MNNTKHTPGPWRVHAEYCQLPHDWKEATVYAADGRTPIAHVAAAGEDETPARLADARLIAAAPQMLAALREIYALLTQDGLSPAARMHEAASFAAGALLVADDSVLPAILAGEDPFGPEPDPIANVDPEVAAALDRLVAAVLPREGETFREKGWEVYPTVVHDSRTCPCAVCERLRAGKLELD